MMRQIFSVSLVMFALFLVAGCGAGKIKPSGKVVQNGQPVTLSDKGVFIIAFYPPDDKEGANPIATTTKPDGTFTIVGRDGQGIAPGTYRVAVKAMDPYPNNDKFQGKFAPGTSKLTVEVASGKEIIIDVGK